MKPEINKILYATDLSENAKHALAYAGDLADKYGAFITIIYVMENINQGIEVQLKDMMGEKEWENLKAKNTEKVVQNIRGRIENFCSDVDAEMDECRLMVEDIVIVKGNPTEEILKASQKINADMIVIGSHGHNIIQSALLGSTTRKVVRNSTIPVLVVRLPED